MGSVRTPTGLDKAGRALWRSIAPDYDLRPDEKRILEDACKQADLIAKVEVEMKDQKLTVKGSQGQDVPNGHIGELRQMRAGLARILSSLKLPDPDAGEKMTPSESARAAANARWNKQKTA